MTLNFNPAADHYDIAVIDTDPPVRMRLATQLADAGSTSSYPTVDAFAEKLADMRPTVAVIGPSGADDRVLGQVEQLLARNSHMAAVLVVDELTTDLLRQALRVGMRDVLTHSADSLQLREAVKRIGESLEAVRTSRAVVPKVTEYGRVITVFSTKGGVGKSVVACNLASVLARRSSKPVAIVDADLQFGDVAVMLGVAPLHTVLDALPAIAEQDNQMLQSVLVRHEPSGLLVLPAPTEPSGAQQISPDDMTRVVNMLREFCEYVIIDTPPYFDDVVLALLEVADEILLVASMDVPSIKNVRVGIQTLELLSLAGSRLKLVLNRANARVKLDIGEVERALKLKAEFRIPSDVSVPQSVNQGIPVVMASPKSPAARSLEQIADVIVRTTAELASAERK